MPINVTNDPSGAAIIDITPAPVRWGFVILLLLVTFGGLGAVLWFISSLHAASGHHGGGGGSAAAIGPIIGASAAGRRLKKVKLGAETIEITCVVGRPTTIPVSQIKSCTAKQGWAGYSFKFAAKYGKSVIKIPVDREVFAVLKTELQKRYSFPMNFS